MGLYNPTEGQIKLRADFAEKTMWSKQGEVGA